MAPRKDAHAPGPPSLAGAPKPRSCPASGPLPAPCSPPANPEGGPGARALLLGALSAVGRPLRRNISADCITGIMSMASNAAPRVTFQMTLFLILFLAMATLVVESAATGRAMLSANSTDTVEPTSKSQQLGSGIQWVQVTAVPLAVFLIGAYMWDIFKNGVQSRVQNRVQNRVQRTAASIIGTILNICRRLALTIKAVLYAPVENQPIKNASNVGLDSAQEEGLELPHSPIDATDLAATLNSLATDASAEMLPELSNVSNGEETEDVGASVRMQV